MTNAYGLASLVQVRKESFGLLFYDGRGPRLTFVHCGPWLQPEIFSQHLPIRLWLQNYFPALSQEKTQEAMIKLEKTLTSLCHKGLIRPV